MSGCARSTTASTRGRKGFVLLALAGAWLASGAARADLIVLTDGGVIKVDAYRAKGNNVVLTLPGGGQMTVSIELIDRAIPDEIVAKEKDPPWPKPPAGFTLGFAPGHQRPDTPYADGIWSAARDNDLNPAILAAVAAVESRFDARAVSNKGARGLLQVMPSTGIRLGVKPRQLFDPRTNLEIGARYLRELADRYSGDLALMLAAYNAGEGAVQKFGGIPPYRETLDYLRRVYARLGLTPPSGS